ncbi:hypothetical protein BC835DRAFT_1419750 [Cytidiella melzeri]|nr:hypothetical protein BC835DRAFT_1419750 [Cytidiella melzeri]
MFKRVQKRQRRQKREEELGIDGDLKEVLGLQDTDSDESDSSSEEEGTSDGEPQGDIEAGGDEDGQDVVSGLSEGDAGLSEDVESDDEDEVPAMSVTEAVKDPVYIVSLQPRTEACILCPGKLLKNQTMSEVHKASKAHSRRYTRFIELVGKAGPDADVRDLIRAMNAESTVAVQPKDTSSSNRAIKRKEKLAAVIAKREAQKKAAQKARKRREELERKTAAASAASNVDASNSASPVAKGPLKKKRKVTSSDGVPKPLPGDNSELVDKKSSGRRSAAATRVAAKDHTEQGTIAVDSGHVSSSTKKGAGMKLGGKSRTLKPRKELKVRHQVAV